MFAEEQETNAQEVCGRVAINLNLYYLRRPNWFVWSILATGQ
jgi:hypothetical protein